MKPEILDRIASAEFAQAEHGSQGRATRPPRELIAFLVYWDRSHRNLKQQGLAALAGVSLSSVERIERAEAVSDEVLDKVAIALGRSEGEFTTPRERLRPEEAAQKLWEDFEPFQGTIPVPVAPLRTESQARALARTEFMYVEAPQLEASFGEQLSELREWTKHLSFAIGMANDKSVLLEDRTWLKPRALYKDFLSQVSRFEASTNAVVLCGTYEAKTEREATPVVKIGAVVGFPKATDPGAIKRKCLFLPAEVSLGEIWRQFIARGGVE